MTTQRHFTEKDISVLLDKIFNTFDVDKNNRFTKAEFPRVVNTVIDLVGGEAPSEDDVQDIFNLLDVNGDETIDRKEFKSLLTTFFKVLEERKIEVNIDRDTDVSEQ